MTWLSHLAAHLFAGLGWIAGLVALVVAAVLYAGRVLLPAWLAPAALGVLALAFMGTTLSKDGVIAGERDKVVAAQRRAEAADNRVKTMERDLAQADANAVRTVLAMREHWQTRLAALDTSTQKEIDHARSENDRLRRDARSGSVSVRLAGAQACPGAGGASPLPGAAAARGVEPQAPELAGEVRERVFDLRGAVLDAEQQIAYLQAYALACAASPEGAR